MWEECEVAVRKILEEKLGMEEAWSESNIAIERAHRVGKFTKDLQRSNYRIQEHDKITQERRSFQPLIEN